MGNAVTAWGEAVSFGIGGWAQSRLGLSDRVNRDSASYKVGFWSSLISPGGWRTLITNPRAAISAAVAAGPKLVAFGSNALRGTVSAAARGVSGIKAAVMKAIDALPVPTGIGPGGVTVGSLRAAARAGQVFVTGPLSNAAKALLRAEARTIWLSRMGREAAKSGLQVHHRVPLEYAHLFPKADPNRAANLIGVAADIHVDITTVGKLGAFPWARTHSIGSPCI